MRFTKIKYDSAKVRIEYEIERIDKKDPDEYTLFSADAPQQSFVDAMKALVADVIAVCELPADDATKIEIRGVTLTHTNAILGACITGLKKLKTANAPLVLNTPHLPSDPYSDNPNEPTMPLGMAERLGVLMLEAQRYVDGERAQASLFTETAADDPGVERGIPSRSEEIARIVGADTGRQA